jgi:hypothetical protein
MVDSGYTKPTNQIVVANAPDNFEILKIKTVANCYPGRLVVKDTDDDKVAVCGAAGSPIGWLGYEQTPKVHRPATVDTIYLVDAKAAVLKKPGMVIVGRLANGQNVAKGADLCAAANGELTAATAITIVASGAANITDGQAVTGTYGAGGPVVAKAVESVNAGGGAADIMVESLI